MHENSHLQSLLRKDARLILPLAATGLTLTLLGNLVLFMIWRLYGGNNAAALQGGAMSLWIAAPGLIAFGIAAMLIGTEEDSGTLRWLRTLPISWRDIAASKFLVGLASYLTVWLLASFCMYLLSYGWAGRLSGRGNAALSFDMFATALFFQLLLLLLGYVVCWSFRMPIMALLVLIPVYTIAAIGLANLAVFYSKSINADLRWTAWAAGFGVLVLLFGIQHLLAKRRLTRVDGRQGFSAQQAIGDARTYRPPSFGVSAKPSIAASLLWQQLRQTASFSLGLILVSAVLMGLFLATFGVQHQENVFFPVAGGLAPLFIPLCASWLGAITFYGDNQYGRYKFFSERGVAPSSVWWTRILPTAVACIVLITLLLVTAYAIDSERLWRIWGGALNLTVTIAVLFAFGQLVSQWVERPVTAFLAAPAYTFLSLLPFFYILNETGGHKSAYPLIGLTVPVLLFATWHLSRRWMAGENRGSYTARAVGYTFVAVAIPCLLLSGSSLMFAVAKLL